MKDQDLIKLRKKAEVFLRYTWSFISDEDVSDFGAFCIEAWLDGRKKSTPFRFLAIDFLRKSYNFSGIKGSQDALSQPDRTYEIKETDMVCPDDIRSFNGPSLVHSKEIPMCDRLVVNLIYVWGFGSREIAMMMGVHETYISLILKRSIAKEKSYLETGA